MASSRSLPVPVDSFVGRETELADGARLLAGSRLLSLVGPGGAGKTRLALRLADRVVGQWRMAPHRCWLVDLSTAGPGGDAPLALVSAALGVPVADEDGLADAIGDAPGLLVVDNSEQVATVVAGLTAGLLGACPGLRVMTTSQQAIGVPGEVVYPVEGLGVPEVGAAGWESAAAVLLFTDRAREVSPGFVAVPEVVQICARLDGMPLAIELAARWARMLSPAEILAELADDRFSLLTSLGPGVRERHRSMWAVIERSYGLLEAEEQALVRRLAVLPGAFDVDTAVAANVADVGRGAMLRQLRGLLAKSLLAPVRAGRPADGGGDQRTRFRMLESIREFGRAQLAATGDEKAYTKRLVGWYSELCAPLADPELNVFPAELMWRLDDDRDNLAAAVQWARDGRDLDALRLLGCSLGAVWDKLGWYGRSAALKHDLPDPPENDTRQRCMVVYARTVSAIYSHDVDEAIGYARELDRIAAGADMPKYRIRALRAQGWVHQQTGGLAAAMACFEAAIAVADEAGHPDIAASLRSEAAWDALEAGDLVRAAELLDQALPVMRTTADVYMLTDALHSSGVLAVRTDDVNTADALFREGLRLAGRAPIQFGDCLHGLVLVAAARGVPVRGLRLAAAANRAPSDPVYDTDGDWNRRVAAGVASCRTALAPERADQAWSEGMELSRDEAIGYALSDTWPHRLADSARDTPADTQLTTRELEVARMVADGLTNRQIAAHLVVSVRTIETHLDHVRAKLGLRSRAQIGTWLAQQRT